MANFDLIKWANENTHVAQETVNDFETAIQRCPGVSTLFNSHSFFKKVINKALKTLYIQNNNRFDVIPSRCRKSRESFAILMGDEFEKCLTEFYLRKENAVYFFDAWPSSHLRIERFIRTFNVKTVFFSSKKVTEIFRKKLMEVDFHWVPEGIDTSGFYYNSYSEKDLDVLQFGRKYDNYHQCVVDRLKEKGYSYLYEKVKGQVVFPTQADFLTGLARTKISICFPSSLTHPSRSGDISTMTVRYLQSMAAKCVIVGVLPEEMVELFDYMPIVEVDFKDPEGQLLSILENYERYIPLIDRNYNTVVKSHTWNHRSQEIMSVLNKRN